MIIPDNLASIPEIDVIKLTPIQAYDRVRALSRIDAAIHLKEVGYNPNPQGHDKVVSKSKYGASMDYKNWMGD